MIMKQKKNSWVTGCLQAVLVAMLLIIATGYAHGMGLGFGGDPDPEPEYGPTDILPCDWLPPSSYPFTSPTAVAVDSDGRQYVVDTYRNRVVVLSQSGKYLKTLARLDKPISVAVDDAGRIYVGNNGRGNVEVYNPDLSLHHKLGFADKEFGQPNGIAVDSDGYVYVADKKKNVVSMYDGDGNYAGLLGGPGQGNGEFHHPLSVTVDEVDQEIIVLDQGAKARIQFFDMGGIFLGSFIRYGNVIGDMARPQQVAVDSEGHLYVTDSFQNLVLVYDKYGNYLGVIADLDHPMRTPLGIATSESNRLYVASRLTQTVEVYGLHEADGGVGYRGMVVDPIEMSFEMNEDDENSEPVTVTVENVGTELFNWTATSEESWLLVAGQSSTGGLIGPGQQGQFQVAVDAAALEPGTYSGNIKVYGGPGVTERVEVTLTVESSPVFSVSPVSLTFVSDVGINPTHQYFTVGNAESASLSWSAAVDQPWMTLESTFGNITEADAGDDVAVLINVIGLPAGTYSGSITVTGLDGNISPSTVGVTLVVNQTGQVYSVTAEAGPDGSLDPSTPSPQIVYYGESKSFTFHADDKCYVASITGCGIDYVNASKIVTAVTETTGAITESCTLYAAFATDAMRLTVGMVGNGTGKVQSSKVGIDCPGNCQNLYDQGDLVTLTAKPLGNSKFAGWIGECYGMDSVCEVTMDQAQTVEAKFTKFPWIIFLPAIMSNSQIFIE